jgi:hypothetical protein
MLILFKYVTGQAFFKVENTIFQLPTDCFFGEGHNISSSALQIFKTRNSETKPIRLTNVSLSSFKVIAGLLWTSQWYVRNMTGPGKR